MGKIIIKRFQGSTGAACKMICYIDDIEICRIREKEQFIYNTEKESCIFKCRLTLGNPWSDEYAINFKTHEVATLNVTQGWVKPKAELRYSYTKIPKTVPEVKAIKQEKKETTISGADEIYKYKKLLDQGIITEKEFEKKKKKILGVEEKTLQSLKCPNCGATYNSGQTQCEYCESYLIIDDEK